MEKKDTINDFGSLGTVEIQTWDEPDLEVFAKIYGSPYASGGSDYSDDSGGPRLDPTISTLP